MGGGNLGVGWYGSFKGHRMYKNTIGVHPFKHLPGITFGTSVADGFLVNSLALKRAICFFSQLSCPLSMVLFRTFTYTYMHPPCTF
jgi:hypothetical protein